jgi:hypothetical protein
MQGKLSKGGKSVIREFVGYLELETLIRRYCSPRM